MMSKLTRYWLLPLMLTCLCYLAGCQLSPHGTESEQHKVCWDLIGEWRYQDADNQFYINLLYADEAMHGVMMNYSFTTERGQPEEKTVESRNMSTFPLSRQGTESLWQAEGMPEGIELFIRLQGEYQVTVNSKKLVCTRSELTH